MLQVGHLLQDGWEAGDVVLVSLDCVTELLNLASAKGLEEIIEPLEISANE